MRVCATDHQGNGVRYARALESRGHRLVGHRDGRIDVLFVDYPSGWGEDSEKWALAREVHELGGLVLEIPHGAAPPVAYDGRSTLCPYVDALVVPAEGQIEWYRTVGIDPEFIVAGWHLCDVKPFTPPEKRETMLFAPAHPNSGDDGHTGVERLKKLNRGVYEQLLELPYPDKRLFMYGTYEANGLEPDSRCRHIRSYLDPGKALAQIAEADVVVSYGTFAYIAVARGKPTVFMPHGSGPIDDDGERLTRSWGKLEPLVRYPIETSDGPLGEMIERACVGGPDTDRWKTLWIGEPTDAGAFAKAVEALQRQRRRQPLAR